MKSKKIIFFMILIGSTGISGTSTMQNHTVSIIMEKTTYAYCERLVYTIEVSEVTGETSISFSSEMIQELQVKCNSNS